MVRSHLEQEDTVVVMARDQARTLLGITIFIMESRFLVSKK